MTAKLPYLAFFVCFVPEPNEDPNLTFKFTPIDETVTRCYGQLPKCIERMNKSWVEVIGAGTEQVNGVYHMWGNSDGLCVGALFPSVLLLLVVVVIAVV